MQANLGGSYARFEAMSSLDKSLFVYIYIGKSILSLYWQSVYISLTYGRIGYMNVLNNPALTLQLGILGKLLGLMGRIVKGCVREVSLAQVSCILMYVYVAPPTPVGAWSMALGLWQRIEYYIPPHISPSLPPSHVYR